jgi:hypothetical protein
MIGVLFFSSCGMMRSAQEKRAEELGKGLGKSLGTFVMKNNSTLVPYDGLKIKPPFIGKTKFILDGGNEIMARDIQSYQTDMAYYTCTSACGWTPRINLAPISKYQGYRLVSEYQSGINGQPGRSTTRRVQVNFIQKENGPLQNYTPKSLYNMVTDYAPGVELLDGYFKKKQQLSGIGWINTGAFIAGFIMGGTYKTDSNISPVFGAVQYAGVGLMTGSIDLVSLTVKRKEPIIPM